MKITAESYYKDRSHLTVSMVNCFARSRDLYRRRYIENVPMEPTASVKIGHYVDSIITGQPPEYKLTPAEQRKADGFIAAFYALPIAEELLAAKKQVILTGKIKAIPIKGKPDFCLPDKTVDLKISNSLAIDKWYWHTLNYRYHWQAGVYAQLRKQNGEKLLPFLHLVGFEQEGLFRYRLFELPPSLCDQGWREFKESAQDLHATLASGKPLADPPLTWESAEMLWRPGEVMVSEEV